MNPRLHVESHFDASTSTFSHLVFDRGTGACALVAAPYLQRTLGGRIGIGAHIVQVQQTFGKLFNAGTEFQRDATLSMPQLILPAVQVNMRAGRLPPAEDNGVHYLKIPVDAL